MEGDLLDRPYKNGLFVQVIIHQRRKPFEPASNLRFWYKAIIQRFAAAKIAAPQDQFKMVFALLSALRSNTPSP